MSSVSMEKIKSEADRYRTGELDKEELDFVLDNLANIIKRAREPKMKEKFDVIEMQRKAKRNSMGGRKKPLVAFKPAPKKVVAKKVMKAPKKVVAKKVTPAKKKMMKMVGNAKKDIMKKSMKKPIAFGNVETALTGKRPRKAPAKPKQVARFYIGGSVLPKGTKAPMPKKTTTMKIRKPMSAETKLKIKRGVKSYHKKCKEAMAMHSKMMK